MGLRLSTAYDGIPDFAEANRGTPTSGGVFKNLRLFLNEVPALTRAGARAADHRLSRGGWPAGSAPTTAVLQLYPPWQPRHLTGPWSAQCCAVRHGPDCSFWHAVDRRGGRSRICGSCQPCRCSACEHSDKRRCGRRPRSRLGRGSRVYLHVGCHSTARSPCDLCGSSASCPCHQCLCCGPPSRPPNDHCAFPCLELREASSSSLGRRPRSRTTCRCRCGVCSGMCRQRGPTCRRRRNGKRCRRLFMCRHWLTA